MESLSPHSPETPKPSKDELEMHSKAVLSGLCKDRGLPSTGSKCSLVNRLHRGWMENKCDQPIVRSPSTKPVYCCVTKCCKNSHSEGVSLHRIPSGRDRKATRKAWIQRLNTVRANLVLSDGTRVCSQHFIKDDFVSPGRLMLDAVPSVFPTKVARKLRLRPNPLDRVRSIMEFESDSCFEPDQPTEKDNVTSRVRDSATQTSHIQFEHCIENDNSKLKETRDIGIQATLPDISIEDLRDDDKKTRFFTGFQNFATFMLVLNVLLSHAQERLNYWGGEATVEEKSYHTTHKIKPGPKRQLSQSSEFLMTMMWYRLGLVEGHLASIFKVSVSSVSRILTTWTQFLYEHTRGLVVWPTKEKVLQNIPHHFINHPRVHTIFDCTEFSMEKASGLEAQAVTWSEYKHGNTIKNCIGVTNIGLVDYISNSWGGRASDRHIVDKENILKRIPSGMSAMADKGFEVQDMLPPGVDLVIPPKVSRKQQMCDQDFFKTVDVAEPRIIVEMKMEQAKNYRILQTTTPISRIATAQQVIHNCFAFTNLLPPLFAPSTHSETVLTELPIYKDLVNR